MGICTETWTLGGSLNLGCVADTQQQYENGAHILDLCGQGMAAENVMLSYLTKLNANSSLCNVIMCKLVYPLAATTFTEEECKAIMWPDLNQGLPAAGFVQTFPSAIVHGPLQYHLNIPNLFTEQITAHIEVLLKYQDQRSNLTGIFSYMSGEAAL